jgi:hypothetical protein
MSQNAVANDVADQLFETERSVDAAMAQAAKLVETMLIGRRTLDLSAVAGQSALRRVAAAVSGLGEVRGSLVVAHANLERLGQSLNLPIEASGGGAKPSDLPFPAHIRADHPLLEDQLP